MLAATFYVIASLTLFQRPVTGSLDRATAIARVKTGILALGSAATALTYLVVLDDATGAAIFLLVAVLALYLVTNDETWESYRERGHRTIERYREWQEEGVHEKLFWR